MTFNDIKAGDVLVRPNRKCKVIAVAEGPQGKLVITVFDPQYQHQGVETVPAQRRTVQIPAGLVEVA